MVLVVERRVPERHDGVAHVFVDGALAVEDGVGQRREEAVHQRGEALRVVLVGLRDRGEAAHVGEHDGHLALLAAEHELFRRLRELLDQGRRQILAEGRADLPALRLLAHEARKDQREIDRRRRHQGIGEIDQQTVLRVEIRRRSDQHGCERRAEGDQRDRPEQRRKRDHQQSEQKRGREFDDDAVDRRRDHLAGQRALEHLGVDFHAGHGARHRRGLDVVEADRRGADQHQLAGDHVGRDVLLQHVDRGNIDRGIVAGVVNPELAIMVGRNLNALDAEALDAGLLGLDQDRARPGGDAQHLERQRRHGLALRLHDHRHPPHDAVALGLDREQAAPGGGVLQHRHVAQQAGEIEHEALRLLAQHRKPGDRQRLVERGDFLRQPGFAEHDAGSLDGVGKDLVVARQRAQPGAGFLVEIAEGVGRKGRVETVGLRKHRVERDHDRAEPGQFGDEIGNPGPRPRPLPELFQALVVDVDDGDRPCRLLARIDALESVKSPDANFLDRRRIGDAQRGKPDQ